MCTSPSFTVRELGSQKQFLAKCKGYLEARKRYPANRFFIQEVPCGNCLECRLKYSADWAFRVVKELPYYEDKYMLTLTYDDEHLPHNSVINKDGEVITSSTLVKRDHQLFMKKLRKKFSDQELKFYMCGEYGSKDTYKDNYGQIRVGTERPHYHIIVLGLKPEDLKFHMYSKCDWGKDRYPLYKSKEIEKLWGMGWVDINEVNYETVAYVARYVTKKIKGKLGPEVYEERGRIPPYTCMSKGLGERYFEDNKEKFYSGETHVVRTNKGIKEIQNPGRYFDKLMEKDNPEEFEKLKAIRHERSKEILRNILNQTDVNRDEYYDNRGETLAKKLRIIKRA